jgi:hypothetical protein
MPDDKSSSIPNSDTISPIAVPIVPYAPSRYDLPGKNYSDRREGEAKLQKDIQAIDELARKAVVNAIEIEQLKEKTGLSNYTPTQRFSLFKEAGLWGQAAYELELNGMDFESITKLLSTLSMGELEKLHNSGKTYVGVGENAQATQITKFILEFERGQSATQIDWAVSNISLRNRAVIAWNRMKFDRNQHIIFPDRVQRENLFFGKQPAYSGFPLPAPGREIPQFPAGKEEISRVVWRDFESEGSSASINIWDNAIFTWGRGFAGKGGALIKILSSLYQDAQIGELFRNVGIHITRDEKLVILDTANNVTIIGGINDSPVWNYIKNNHALLLFFVSLSEMKYMPFIGDDSTKQQIRQKIINEQFNFIVKNNPVFTIPQEQLGRWKAFLGNDYENFIAFIAHLFHWQPLYGKNLENNILKNDNGAYVSGAMKELLLRFAEKAAIPSDTYWFSVSSTNIPVFISNLSKAKGGIAKFILDAGHFLRWGNGIAKKIFNDANAAIPFSDVSEINTSNPQARFRLDTPQFQGAAVYFKPDLKSGYIIKR